MEVSDGRQTNVGPRSWIFIVVGCVVKDLDNALGRKVTERRRQLRGGALRAWVAFLESAQGIEGLAFEPDVVCVAHHQEEDVRLR